MTKVTYVDYEGAALTVEANAGISIMQAALNNGIVSIEGECGGAGACATCHVYIPPAWQPLTGPRSEDEAAMLEFVIDVDARSRLGCQIMLRPELDGLTVYTPRSQR